MSHTLATVLTPLARRCATGASRVLQAYALSVQGVVRLKLIASKTQVLERKNAALRLEVASLQAEVQRVKQAYKDSWTKGKRHEKALIVVATNSQTLQSQPYLQPTIASANRAKPKSRTSTTEGGDDTSRSMQSLTGLQYDDGKLIVRDAKKRAGFMKHTRSSRAKSRGMTWDDPWAFALSDLSTLPSTPEYEQSSDYSKTCEQCEHLDKSNEDETDQSLKARSRLHEYCFSDIPALKCPVPFRTQNRLLKAALRLAQATLWTALRAHWPEFQRRKYLEGPEQVKFGRDGLYFAGFGNENYPDEVNRMCGHPPRDVIGSILGVVYLRNAVCHPGYHSTQEIDRLLWYAQDLAVVLQDEKRAFKVRALRDELQQAAMESYEEIKARVGMAALPFAKPWPLHLQHSFSWADIDVCYVVERSDYPVEVVYASRMWRLLYIRPGEWHPAYLSNVAKAESFMRSTCSGRRTSLCLLPAAPAHGGNEVDASISRTASVMW